MKESNTRHAFIKIGICLCKVNRDSCKQPSPFLSCLNGAVNYTKDLHGLALPKSSPNNRMSGASKAHC